MTMRIDPRHVRYAVAAAIVAALVAVAAWPSARLVDSGEAARGPVRETIEAEGRTRLRDRYVIAAPIAAMARRLQFEPGDAIEAGQVLIVLDPVTAPALDTRSRAEAVAHLAAARARYRAAREQTRAAQAIADQLRNEATRQRELQTRELVAAEPAERAIAASLRADREAASAKFQEATARHEVTAAEVVLARGSRDQPGGAALELAAPVDGVVLRRHFESARPVQAGEALIEIGDPAGMEVEVEVLSADAVRLREGMRVELLRWGGEPPLAGRVRRVEPGGFTKFSALGVEEQRVWVIVEITSPRAGWEALGEAYRVNARFILRESADALRVPSSAAFTANGRTAVFRIDGAHARLTAIEPGIEGEGWLQVNRGLEQGDRVVLHPDRELEDGQRVRIRR
jgi:HlyD family secretion protein